MLSVDVLGIVQQKRLNRVLQQPRQLKQLCLHTVACIAAVPACTVAHSWACDFFSAFASISSRCPKHTSATPETVCLLAKLLRHTMHDLVN